MECGGFEILSSRSSRWVNVGIHIFTLYYQRFRTKVKKAHEAK